MAMLSLSLSLSSSSSSGRMLRSANAAAALRPARLEALPRLSSAALALSRSRVEGIVSQPKGIPAARSKVVASALPPAAQILLGALLLSVLAPRLMFIAVLLQLTFPSNVATLMRNVRGFVDRNDEAKALLEKLKENQFHGHFFSLYGSRAAGKSGLVRCMLQQKRDGFIYVQLEDVALTLDEVAERIFHAANCSSLDEISLAKRYGPGNPVRRLLDVESGILAAASRWYARWKPQERIYLVLDSVDGLPQATVEALLGFATCFADLTNVVFVFVGNAVLGYPWLRIAADSRAISIKLDNMQVDKLVKLAEAMTGKEHAEDEVRKLAALSGSNICYFERALKSVSAVEKRWVWDFSHAGVYNPSNEAWVAELFKAILKSEKRAIPLWEAQGIVPSACRLISGQVFEIDLDRGVSFASDACADYAKNWLVTRHKA